ncbi:MAG: hypothetical protein SF097_21315 [Acidobacteriota bacterium]|nr:hypothetical protein [Acidobacteriota bacterium]
MSVNSFQPHILVLPEDDADRQLANGFLLEVDWMKQRQMQVLNEVGGWIALLECFKSVHIKEMERCTYRFMVLLIDFDQDKDRLEKAKKFIPENLKERVFVLGSWSKPEDLKAGRSLETVGRELARECREETDKTWEHNLLRHNAGELKRLRQIVRPILFHS